MKKTYLNIYAALLLGGMSVLSSCSREAEINPGQSSILSVKKEKQSFSLNRAFLSDPSNYENRYDKLGYLYVLAVDHAVQYGILSTKDFHREGMPVIAQFIDDQIAMDGFNANSFYQTWQGAIDQGVLDPAQFSRYFESNASAVESEYFEMLQKIAMSKQGDEPVRSAEISIRQLKALETQIMADANLSENNRQALLQVASVARYSIAYWTMNFYNEDSKWANREKLHWGQSVQVSMKGAMSNLEQGQAHWGEAILNSAGSGLRDAIHQFEQM